MKVLYAASEVFPFAKTGGLADVAGALPRALRALGHQPSLIMPLYAGIAESWALEDTGVLVNVPILEDTVTGRILRSTLPDSDIPVYFIEQAGYFERDGIYGAYEGDYADNCERYAFFCRAVLEAIRELELDLDVIHLNDWQMALIAVYQKLLYAKDEIVSRPATLLTIHNLAYQGKYWHWDMRLIGIDWKHFNWRELECYGKLNLLKGGLVYADVLSTVSPEYAREIQTPESGCNLDGVLRERREHLFGVINALDTSAWDPETDPDIAANYSHSDTRDKFRCKLALQRECGLELDSAPIVAMVCRLTDQKGIDVLVHSFPRLMERHVQFVLLGTGEENYHQLLEGLAKQYSSRVSVHLGFDTGLAHRIHAGADIMLMPSRYEPCGLVQLSAQRYGTVPVANATGGLIDTIADADENRTANGSATGFLFSPLCEDAMLYAVDRALEVFGDSAAWRKLMRAGMRRDFSWAAGAESYARLYARAIEEKNSGGES